MSNVFAGFHVVFVTKERKSTIPFQERRKLYNYIYGILKNQGCKTLRINGMTDHVHIAFELNPTIALADLVRDIKRSTSIALTREGSFPAFMGWARGYYACSFSPHEKDQVIHYIMNQEDHHAGTAIDAELEWLSIKAGLQYFPNDYMH
ncbi:MAG: IS200/IS605 family transposase [Muribaculaceae bacterium]|nr:IS200/IS605 family transposase [Muribaculaceae bacterium]